MIGFEILHYQTIEDTIACIESILEFVPNSVIVVVDNASPNGSGGVLARRYAHNYNITIIHSQQNEGFANGNNIGYKYLKENYDCNYICCVNNDTLIIENGFQECIEKIYDDYGFGVLAPKVIMKDGSIQNFNPQLHEKSYYEQEIRILEESPNYRSYLKNKGMISVLFDRYPSLMKFIRRIKQKIRKPYSSLMQNVVLHGCFLIFSKSFIELFEEPFNNRTFMYREEELLYLRTQKAGLLTLYCEEISILHKEDASTNATYNDKESKYQFMKKNQIASTKILLEELRNGR